MTKEQNKDDDFMDDATSVESGTGKWSPKKGRPKKRDDIHTVNVDLSLEMLERLDQVANYLNISRQAVIKSFCLSSLTQHENQLDRNKKVS